MKSWIKSYEFKKGNPKKHPKKCKNCGIEFLSNGPTEHCSLKCMIHLKTEKIHRGCWIWKGTKTNKGYGKTTKSKLVHRLSWEAFKGKIPLLMNVLHHCDEPACCNPEHLFLGSQKENVQDMCQKGRKVSCVGSKNGMSKLSEFDVIEIRKLSSIGITNRSISEKYGLCESEISQILYGKKWGHVKTGIKKSCKRRNLTDLEVREIKRMLKENMKNVDIANKISVSVARISHIKCGRNWTDI